MLLGCGCLSDCNMLPSHDEREARAQTLAFHVLDLRGKPHIRARSD